ncbi:MAG: hypothetical protein EOP10_30740 [Proteobacteria bacterium]|nr:MAG: hypothetical protein EOP10_30740 [Pseudomonadota bacterium]
MRKVAVPTGRGFLRILRSTYSCTKSPIHFTLGEVGGIKPSIMKYRRPFNRRRNPSGTGQVVRKQLSLFTETLML